MDANSTWTSRLSISANETKTTGADELKQRPSKNCKNCCECSRKRFVFYYHELTDFLVMRCFRNPLLYAIWATVWFVYTLSQLIYAEATRQTGHKHYVEVTFWGFYTLVLRFLVTAINAWRFVKQNGAGTLPDEADIEDVILIETITVMGDDVTPTLSPAGSVTSEKGGGVQFDNDTKNYEFELLDTTAKSNRNVGNTTEPRTYQPHNISHSILVVEDIEYLQEIRVAEPKRRHGCCRCTHLLVKKVNVPIIEDKRYPNGAIGQFLVKQVQRDNKLYKLPLLLSFQWILQNISNNMALGTSVVYWINYLLNLGWAAYGKDVTKDLILYYRNTIIWKEINNHVLNCFIATSDMNMSSAPVRFAHVYMPMLFSLVYSGFTWVYWYAGGTNDKEQSKCVSWCVVVQNNTVVEINGTSVNILGGPLVYEILDYDARPWDSAFFICLFTFVVVPLSQLVIYLLFRIRENIFKRVHKVKRRVVRHVKNKVKTIAVNRPQSKAINCLIREMSKTKNEAV